MRQPSSNWSDPGPSSRTCTTKKTPVSEAYVDLSVDSPESLPPVIWTGTEKCETVIDGSPSSVQVLLLQCHVLILHMQLSCNF